MTPWHYLYLCVFSYNDLVHEHVRMLGEACLQLLNRPKDSCGQPDEEMRGALKVIMETPSLALLEIVEYVNHNRTTGFVGYAFRSADGKIHCAFRGSERAGCNTPTSIDWVDNFAAPFVGSVQYGDICAFSASYPLGDVTFTGHSKGGHNALYALAVSPNRSSHAIAFDGQGFPPCLFTQEQARALRKRGINYVVQNDLVGALMWHPEKRVFVKKNGDANPHSPASFTFGPDGYPVPGRRPFWSYLVEMATRLYLRSLPANQAGCAASRKMGGCASLPEGV